MDTAELDNSLREMMEKGFDDSFAAFCAEVFSSYQYSPEKLALAKMHAFYLRIALENLSCPETREELLTDGVEGEDNLDRAFRTVAVESYRTALFSDRPFHELFVELWCAFWSEGGQGSI